MVKQGGRISKTRQIFLRVKLLAGAEEVLLELEHHSFMQASSSIPGNDARRHICIRTGVALPVGCHQNGASRYDVRIEGGHGKADIVRKGA